MFCPKCGSANGDESLQCGKCGQVLKTVAPASSSSDPMSTIIPFKNEKALIAYYLGVFSIIPCLGIPLGIAAVYLGQLGLKAVAKNPAVKGTVHAWIGILGGGFFLIVNLVGILLVIVHK